MSDCYMYFISHLIFVTNSVCILLSLSSFIHVSVPPVEHKECYYRLNDENLCESVLTSHVTLQECCCTLGAGWGDNCEVHPCPVNGTCELDQ